MYYCTQLFLLFDVFVEYVSLAVARELLELFLLCTEYLQLLARVPIWIHIFCYIIHVNS
jgi:hypothetical protein